MWEAVATGVIGVVLGAGLTGLLAIVGDKRRIRREQVSKTYADFLSDLAGMSYAKDKERAAAESKLAGTIARLAVYGSSDVVERLAEFMKAGSDVRDPKIAGVVEAMRGHVGEKPAMSVEVILTGPSSSEGTDG